MGKYRRISQRAHRQLEIIVNGVTVAGKGKSDRTLTRIAERLAWTRCIRSPSAMDSVLGDQFAVREKPLGQEQADETTRRLLNSFRDKKQDDERIRLFNWPASAVTSKG
jgi:hypothetical protein